jgi:general stress protein 26
MDTDLGELQELTFARATAATRTSYPPHRRLTGEQLAEYLDRRAFAVVGSSRPDGRPHTALSSYVRRGSRFWLPTVAGAVRAHNVGHQPWMTLVVTEGDRGAHIAVLLEGPAQVVEPAAVPGDVATTIAEAWVSSWLRLDTRRVLSYATEDALA